MSKLLEIFGRAIALDTADLIWHWLDVTGAAEQENPDQQTVLINKVVELVAERKTDSAQQQLRLYLFDNPSCIHGRLAAAAICLPKGQLEEAIEQLNSVYLRQPNNTMALYALGHCYERLGKEAQAIEFYQDCLKFKNYLQLPRQRLAAIYFKNSQLEKTTLEYELLKEQYPNDMSTLVTLGHLYIAQTDYSKAVDTFNTAILIHPDNFHTQQEDEIDELIRQGRLDEALEQLQQLCQQQPERPDLAIKQAEVLVMLGADYEAVRQYQRAVQLCPDSLEATIKLGTHYLKLQWDRQAAQQFNKAADINDRIVDCYIGLATAQKLAGNLEEALGTLSLAAAIGPNSSFLIAETASLQFKASVGENIEFHTDENHSEILHALIKSPDLYYRFGVLMLSADRISQAAEAFQAALLINPACTPARTKLVVCLFETGKKQQALELLTGPECIDKGTLELHYRTALLYCDKIRFAGSLINLETNMEKNFAQMDATVNISIVLQNLGLLDRAEAMWDNLSDTTEHAIGRGGPFWPGQL